MLRPSRLVRSSGLAILMVLAGCAAFASAEVVMPPSLRILEGDARLKAPGEAQAWRQAKAGQVVDFGLVVSTGDTFAGSIHYADGTMLTLKPGSMIQVLSDGLRLYRGSAWIKVTKRGKSFTCTMPAAIASVRGTRFSCEVPSYGKVFGDRYVSEFFNRTHVSGSGLRGHVLSANIGLALLAGLIADAPGGKAPSAVKVFEGKVMVVYPAPTGAILQSWLVTAGEKVDTAAGERASKQRLALVDYAPYAEAVPAGLLGPVGKSGAAQKLAPVAAPVGPVGRDAVPSRELKLLNEAHEKR